MAASAKRFIFVTGIVAATCLAGAGAMAQDPNSTYSLGVEGFYDNYKEPDATVDSTAYYGSLTGNYTHNWNAFFAALDGRASYGQNDYKSDSGTANGIGQWEFEFRPRVGYTFAMGAGGFSPYTGLGLRYFRDDGKNVVTDLGFAGYDRRITQLYLPAGATYAFTTTGGWTISPNLEYDHLLWGQVSSRLGNAGSGIDPGTGDFVQNVNNVVEQENGWGVRGNLMFGKEEPAGWSWQAGPFFRYWDIKESTTAVGQYITTPTTPPTQGVGLVVEPHNTRLQAGLALRFLW